MYSNKSVFHLDINFDLTSSFHLQETTPHLVNLNEDTMLSGVIFHFLKEGQTRIGRKDTSPDIAMTGLSISADHAIIQCKAGEVTIMPASQGAKTKVNGSPITGEQGLRHNDRKCFYQPLVFTRL